MSEPTKETQKIEPVVVIKKRCKSCKDCVYVCPAGVLSMAVDVHSISGLMISVDYPESCIGCNLCENACPDIALFVADKSKYQFCKITKEAKERQAKILANDCLSLPKEGEKNEKA